MSSIDLIEIPMDGEVIQSNQPIAVEEILLVPRHNAKRYIARVDAEGNIVVTIPKRGSRKGAVDFAREHTDWLRKQQRLAVSRKEKNPLRNGDWIWFRGSKVELIVSKDWGRPVLRFSKEMLFIADEDIDLARPLGEKLRSIAKEELPERVACFAKKFELKYSGVSIRNQKTRWGSCSSTGRISLNWRLMMTPPEVSDYIVIHELMHLKEMNHSHLFWGLVREACPNYKAHERWLNEHQSELSWG